MWRRFRGERPGVNISNEEFLRQVKEYNPDILAMSSLLTTTMPEMKNVIALLKEKVIRDRVIIMVGAAPINLKYADDIGADAYALDAVKSAKKLMESPR